MTNEFPTDPRQALEASLTAMLLGELSPHQAEFLQRAMELDPELARIYERLQGTIELVQEAEAGPPAPTEAPMPLKLGNDRREQLLQHFKTVTPKQFVPERKRRVSPLLLVAALVLLSVFLASMLLPALSRAKSRGMRGYVTASAPQEYARVAADEGQKQASEERLGRIANGAVVTPQKETTIVLPRSGSGENSVAGVDGAEARLGGVEANKKAADAKAASIDRIPRVIVAGGGGFGGGGGANPQPVAKEPAKMEDRAKEVEPGQALAAGQATELADHGVGLPTAEAAPVNERPRSIDPSTGLPAAEPTLAPSQTPAPPLGGELAQQLSRERLAGGPRIGGRTGNSALALAEQNGRDSRKQVREKGVTATSALPAPAEKPWKESMEVMERFRRRYGLSTTPSPPAPKQQVADLKNALAERSTESEPSASARSERELELSAQASKNPAPAPLLGDTPMLGKAFQRQNESGWSASATARDFYEQNPTPPASNPQLAESDLRREYALTQQRLNQLLQFQAALKLKREAETTDLRLPKSNMVAVVAPASAAPAEGDSLGARLKATLGGSFEKKARIRVERDSSDISGLISHAPGAYDPYFIQTEYEVIASEAVLGPVVDQLKLQDNWGKETKAGHLTKAEAIGRLKKMLDLRQAPNSSVIEIGVRTGSPEESAQLANAIADSYANYRIDQRKKLAIGGIEALQNRLAAQSKQITEVQQQVEQLREQLKQPEADIPAPKTNAPPPIPQPEVNTRENAFSTFSLNVSDVSFKLAAASLEKGALPDPASIRSEEFINAFDYRDPEPPMGVPVGFAWERAQDPFAQNRDLLRFSVKTAAAGRQAGRPLNLVLLLDNSGSMERADRVQIIRDALRVLAAQLQPQDKISLITFARTATLRADGLPGNQAAHVAEEAGGLTPQGGTNLEDAMNLAYATARKHYLAGGINRIVLLTDGAANLGDVNPENLKKTVENQRKQGIAFDCFGIGWEGYNDDLLEQLSSHGDGRYGFLNSPEEAASGFAPQLAGALRVAASDVKVQVEFNPKRVSSWRQIGYAKHQLTKEQFRDNTVDAAELGAAESGNALYVVQVNPNGEGALATVRARYKVPGTTDYYEHEWVVPYNGTALSLAQSSAPMRLAGTAAAFSEWLASNPYAGAVNPDALLQVLRGVPEVYGADTRPQKLEWMIRQANSLSGK